MKDQWSSNFDMFDQFNSIGFEHVLSFLKAFLHGILRGTHKVLYPPPATSAICGRKQLDGTSAQMEKSHWLDLAEETMFSNLIAVASTLVAMASMLGCGFGVENQWNSQTK